MSKEPGSRDTPSTGVNSFEERLKAARGRQGLDAPPVPSGGSPEGADANPWGIGLRVGIEMVSAMVVAVAIGYGLDRLFHTLPILTGVFVLLGGAAGILNVYRLFAPKRDGAR